MKACVKCGTEKPLSYYHQDKRNKDGHRNVCMACCKERNAVRYASDPERAKAHARAWKERNPEQIVALRRAHYLAKTAEYRATARKSALKRDYNISLKDYDDMLASQGGRCAVCETDNPGKHTKHFAIDHDHACCPGKKSCGGCIRGLLCSRCNTAIARLGDSIEGLTRALAYLQRAKS